MVLKLFLFCIGIYFVLGILHLIFAQRPRSNGYFVVFCFSVQEKVHNYGIQGRVLFSHIDNLKSNMMLYSQRVSHVIHK